MQLPCPLKDIAVNARKFASINVRHSQNLLDKF